MTHENINITIMKRLKDLGYKLRRHPVRFEEALDDLTTKITNGRVMLTLTTLGIETFKFDSSKRDSDGLGLSRLDG